MASIDEKMIEAMKQRNVLRVIICTYDLALIAIMCYMVVNHGLGWVLLVLFYKYESGEKKNEKDD